MATVTHIQGAGVSFTFALEGAEKVDVGLSRFGVDIKDWTPFFRDELAPQFFRDVISNFDSQGRKYTGSWPELSPAYRIWKAAHFPGKPILVRSGKLRGSLVPGGGPGQVRRVSSSNAEFGTSIPYGDTHQKGRGRIPQRRFLFLQASQTYGRILHGWLVRMARELGLKAA